MPKPKKQGSPEIPAPVPFHEFQRQAEAEVRQRDRVVYCRGRTIILMNGTHPYEIPLSRCDTSAKALSWVAHLSEKAWVEAWMLRRFVMLAVMKAGAEIDWNA